MMHDLEYWSDCKWIHRAHMAKGMSTNIMQRVLPCSEETKNGRVAYDHPGTQFPRLDTPPSSDNEGAVSQVDDHWVLAEKPEKSRRPATAAPGILAPGKWSLTTSLKEN